jgi:DNA-binding CsgD family transcriptional regulator
MPPARQRLNETDLRSVLDVARELAAMRDLEELRAGVLPRLRRLVRCDNASFNEIAPAAREAVIAAVEPEQIIWDDAEEIFGRYAHQNPLIAAAAGSGDAGVKKFSDLISPRQLHGLDIYDLIYRRIDVEHQMAFTLPAPSARVVGFAFNRGRGQGDFSERDRSVLEAVRPFVVQAYEAAGARGRTSATLAALGRAVEAAAGAVLLLDRDGGIAHATDLAARWLDELAAAGTGVCLPAPLEEWIAAQRRRARAGLPCGERLRLRAPSGALTAQFVAGEDGHADAVLLRAQTRPHARDLRALGLTSREIQVLSLLAGGLANAEIARELALSERTVAKHLEHVYAKLGVPNRTAAVARLREHAAARP